MDVVEAKAEKSLAFLALVLSRLFRGRRKLLKQSFLPVACLLFRSFSSHSDNICHRIPRHRSIRNFILMM